MKHREQPNSLDTARFPVDPWRLVECEYGADDLGVTESLFAIGNGYIGMRANATEGREAHSHGTYLNGFHETWDIKHAEDAFAFAKTGQTTVNVPDAKLMKLYVDDEPLLIATADLEHYERVLNFRTGVSSHDVVWHTPGGKRIRVRSERLVSFHHRHLAMMMLEFTMLDGAAPVVVSSQLMNRQDGEDEYHVRTAALGEGRDPRQARRFQHRVLLPRLQRRHEDPGTGGEVLLGYQCANSGMTLACGYQHLLQTSCTHTIDTTIGADLAKTVFTIDAVPGETVRIAKLVAYHTSTGVPAEELADRCHRTLARARSEGPEEILAQQRAWLDEFWFSSDVEIRGDAPAQQAVRWNLFQLAQASARTQEQGIAAKGLTGGGYDGHYFWDTEVYVIPFLAYTSPDIARKLLRFRWRMLPAARRRAAELSQHGALYPWRTINGDEASAYYAAGTAQYHINSAVAYALERYLNATGDVEFLVDEGAEMMVETARLWEDLGFYATNGDASFHIHSVTGPDEYTTVVNDNTYTNVMARFNLSFAAKAVEFIADWDTASLDRLRRRTGFDRSEIAEWKRAAHAMFIPYDEALGIHPQDTNFLERERWDFENTPLDHYPLLLHYHPLVIYRFQVLKQADVVLAMYMRSETFTREEKRRDFDYYDPITTNDSSLSACVQAIIAAEVGHDALAFDYFQHSLFLDLCNLHGNTPDGVHVASCGGVWAALVHGFAGMVDNGEWLRFEPRLPAGWDGITFRLLRHGARLVVDVDKDGCTVTVETAPGAPIQTPEGVVRLNAGEQVRIPRAPDRSDE